MSEARNTDNAGPAVLLLAPLPGDRRVLTTLLEQLGFAIEHCHNGAELESALAGDADQSGRRMVSVASADVGALLRVRSIMTS